MSTTADAALRPAGATHTFVGPLVRAELIAAADTAVACGPSRLNYAELCARARRLVGALRALGLQRGDRVAVVGPNCHCYLELYLAIPAGGFVLVPLNARHAEPELRYALEDAGARVLIADAHCKPLANAVEHFVAFGGDYEQLIAEAPESGWADVAEHDLAGLFYT